MPAELDYAVRSIFRSNGTTSRGLSYYVPASREEDSKKLYMEIPINTPSFELPAFAYSAFETIVGKDRENCDAIVVTLKTMGREPRYSTLNRYMRDILNNDYANNKLIRVNVKQTDNTFKKYYVTQGAVFMDDFKPIMMCSWLVERFVTNEKTRFKFIKPILRIEPWCFLSKEDAMQKFIATKMPTLVLDQLVDFPYVGDLDDVIIIPNRISSTTEVKVEIDRNPFVLKKSDTPSISTTREDLLQLAIDHIDEFIQ